MSIPTTDPFSDVVTVIILYSTEKFPYATAEIFGKINFISLLLGVVHFSIILTAQPKNVIIIIINISFRNIAKN